MRRDPESSICVEAATCHRRYRVEASAHHEGVQAAAKIDDLRSKRRESALRGHR